MPGDCPSCGGTGLVEQPTRTVPVYVWLVTCWACRGDQ